MDSSSSSRLPTLNSAAYQGYSMRDWIDNSNITNNASFAVDMGMVFGADLPADPSNYPYDPPGLYGGNDFGIAQAEQSRGAQATETLTISTAFQETPSDPSHPIPDIILISSDAVVFYVDQTSLMKASNNGLGGLLPITPENNIERVRYLPRLHSSELNIILHILYNTSCAHFHYPLHLIISSIDHLPEYGIAPKLWITQANSIYDLLLPLVPIYPLDIYCLCGRHDLYELATTVSPHLLSFDTSLLTDGDAERMGSLYLSRLFRLHRTRVETLMKSLMPAPAYHSPTTDCGFESQKTLSSAWTMVVAYLAWSVKPDLSTSTIRHVFDSMTQHITCDKCLEGRDERVNKIVVKWSMTKNTI